MNTFSFINNAYYFEQIVGKILRQNYELKENNLNNKYEYNFKFDFITINDIKIEVKYSSKNDFNHILTLVRNYIVHNSDELIFVTNIFGSQEIINNSYFKNSDFRMRIITLENLLYLCGNNEELKSELLSCVTFSTEKVIPMPLNEYIEALLKSAKKATSIGKQNNASFKDRLSKIEAGIPGFKQYEDFCADFIKTIFEDNIDTPIVQHKSNKDLFRFDMVAALKNNPESFWKFIYDKFNSCFVLFECKNYSEEIKQEQIYLTERYLYNNALRNVGIILTRGGADKNALRASQDILKEHGKLILILNDRDIKNLDKIYNDYKIYRYSISPSDYLMNKTKEFLLNLDK